jgi:hypothetical protein
MTDVDEYVRELNPAQAAAYWYLRDRIVRCIDNAECILDNSSDPVVLALAHNEMPRLIAAVRGVMKDHRTDKSGNCTACGYRPNGDTFEPRPWPCPVVNSVHEYLNDPDRVFTGSGAVDSLYA